MYHVLTGIPCTLTSCSCNSVGCKWSGHRLLISVVLGRYLWQLRARAPGHCVGGVTIQVAVSPSCLIFLPTPLNFIITITSFVSEQSSFFLPPTCSCAPCRVCLDFESPNLELAR
ncbi:hypothetical protein V2G26_006721 [Clonostachys chloroleuca]